MMNQLKDEGFDSRTVTAALAAAEVGLWVWYAASGTVRWSATLEALYGLSPGTFEGTFDAFRSRLHADDREQVIETIEQARKANSKFRVQHRIQRPDGTVRWVEERGEPLQDESHRAIGMMATTLDITGLKHNEENTAYLSSEFKTLLDVIPVGIGIAFDSECLHISANPSFASMLGIAPETNASLTAPQAERPPYRAFYNGQEVRGEDLPIQVSAAQGVQVPPTEVEVRWGDGTTRVVMAAAVPMLDEQGRPQGSIGSIWDVTELKQTEVLLAARSNQQALLARLGILALQGMGLAELMHEAIAGVASTLGVEYCKILELLPDGQELLLRDGVVWKEGLVGRATVGAGLDSQAGYTLHAREPIVVEDLRRETRFSGPPLLFEHSVVSGISVIIQRRGRPFGVMGAHTTRHRSFTPDDTNFLQAVANIVATAIDREERERVIRELSTPIMPIGENVLLCPIVGQFDERRASQLETQLLQAIRDHRARLVVLDVTGALRLNAEVVERLLRTLGSAKLLGAEVILTGVSTEVAETFTNLELDLSKLHARGSLQDGIEEANRVAASSSNSTTAQHSHRR